MEISQVKGNTWMIKSWELIPFYRLDAHRIILLDSGQADQRTELEELLQREQLVPAAVLSTHAHIDHVGNNRFLREKYGARIALPLGEAGTIASKTGIMFQNIHQSFQDVNSDILRRDLGCVTDRIILPEETRVEICGVPFGIIHTPGHSVDHICIRTPDNVLYAGDALITARTLEHAKFPYAVHMQAYFDSLNVLRRERADIYIAAHEGVYTDLIPEIDKTERKIRTLLNRYLLMLEEKMTANMLTARICRTFGIDSHEIFFLAYLELSVQVYLNYFREHGLAECWVEDNMIWYRRKDNE